MYQKGSCLFYAQAGVCRVVDVGPLDRIPDARKGLYYTLEVVGEPGRVFVPVDTAAYLRPVLTCEEARALLGEIPSPWRWTSAARASASGRTGTGPW